MCSIYNIYSGAYFVLQKLGSREEWGSFWASKNEHHICLNKIQKSTEQNIFWILLNHTKFGCKLLFSDWFGTKWNIVSCKINRWSVIIIQIWFYLPIFRKDISFFSSCVKSASMRRSALREASVNTLELRGNGVPRGLRGADSQPGAPEGKDKIFYTQLEHSISWFDV